MATLTGLAGACIACVASLGAVPKYIELINEEICVSLVRSAAAGLSPLLQAEEDPLEQEAMLRMFVEPVRFYSDESGYFFVYNNDGKCVAHPVFPELVGKPLMELQDRDGKPVIQKLLAAAKEGGGFVRYVWTNPITGEAEEKRGFAVSIEGTDFVIGSGVYSTEQSKTEMDPNG